MNKKNTLSFFCALAINTISAYDCLPSCPPIFVETDFLYWRADEEGLEYAESSTISTQDGVIVVDDEVNNLRFPWRPGFKIGIGQYCECWDLGLKWTNYYTHAKDSTGGIGSSLLISPIWSPTILGDTAREAKADWRLHYNIIDLSLGRQLDLCKNLFLHPFLGIRAAFINQKYNADYAAIFSFTEDDIGSLLEANTSFDAKTDQNSVGLRFGINGDVNICYGLSLIGQFSSSLLYSNFCIKERFNGGLLRDVDGSVALIPERFLLKEDLHTARLNFEGLLGLEWSNFFIPMGCNIHFAAFYEFAYWLHANQLINRIVSVNSSPISDDAEHAAVDVEILHQNGDLQLQGLTLLLRLERIF